MPVSIIKAYKGSNIIKAKTPSGQIRYGYRWTLEGKKYQKVRWKNRGEAEAEFDKFKVKMRNPNRLGWEDEAVTIDLLLEAWKEKAKVRGLSEKRIKEVVFYVERFRDVSGCRELRKITENHFVKYQANRLSGEKPKHHHTINKETDMIRTCLRSALSLFPGFNWIPPKFDRLVQKHHGRDVVLSRDELMKIIDTLGEKVPESNRPENERRGLVRDIVIIAIETTMRISELVKLEKSQVSLSRGIGYKHGYIAVKNAKTLRPKTIPLTPNGAAVLKKRVEDNPGKFVFKREDQAAATLVGIVRRAFKKACKRAGIPYGLSSGGAVFHTIRHSTTTYLVNKKVPLPQVMAITGHSKKTMLLVYAHPTAETMEEATKLLTLDMDEERDKKSASGGE